VTFLSILELAKERLLDIVQEAPFAAIYVKSLAAQEGDNDSVIPELSSEFDDDATEASSATGDSR
jgi:segregation and condensation protein A